ncbi:MAG: leucine-rich repeat domain-containing protein [Promethearchaeota archaeon]
MVIIHGIELIESDAVVLRELDQLTQWDIKPNSITAIKQHQPGFNTVNGRITALSLGFNQLTYLPEKIGQLTSLEILDLFHTSISSLPETIGQLTSLQVLCLSRNQLASLPETIGQLTSLEKLELEDNQFESLPETIGQLTSLQELWLGGNQFESLPETLHLLTSLQVLCLSRNQLTSFPETIGQLTSLKKLELEDNQFKSLPETIGQLTSLQELWLGGNQLSSLPEALGSLLSLQFLSLADNQLTSFPETLGSLPSLQSLTLNNNPLDSLPDSFGALSSLEELRLYQCQFEKIPNVIRKMSNLTYLSLAENPLVGEDAEMIKNEIPTIQDFLRKRADFHIFLSYAIEPATTMLIPKIAEWLEQQDEIYKVWYCERDMVGNIDGEMEENVSNSQIFLFLATKHSIRPETDCRFEIAEAKKNKIEIIPIKTREINWDELAEFDLDRQQGKELTETEGPIFETFRQELYEYILQYKRKQILFDSEKQELNKLKKKIRDHYHRFIESELFDRTVIENKERFKLINEEFKAEKAPELEIYGKLFDILLKGTDS